MKCGLPPATMYHAAQSHKEGTPPVRCAQSGRRVWGMWELWHCLHGVSINLDFFKNGKFI